jgi:hypothetical protein
MVCVVYRKSKGEEKVFSGATRFRTIAEVEEGHVKKNFTVCK